MTTIPESLLHYIWQFKSFAFNDLQTTQGDALQLLHVGTHNPHAGADFSEARLYINDVLWVGNIEIHVRASDWLRHQHQHDEAYNTVILHVVYENDTPICLPNGTPLPTFELRDRIAPSLLQRYWTLYQNQHWIPCQAHWATVSDLHVSLWLERLAVERLQQRVQVIADQLAATQNHWEEVFYQSVARSLGGKVNADAMQLLAESMPLRILAKHKNNLLQVESLLLGQAGLLAIDTADAYVLQLQKEYQYLQHKYALMPMQSHAWKFARLRPANFPTLRIAQLAQLIYQSNHLFSKILDCVESKSCRTLFALELHSFWQTHYTLLKESDRRAKTLGDDALDLLMINTVVPFVFAYGSLRGDSRYCDKALAWLEQLAPEQNSIIDGWATLGVAMRNAHQTQALLQLKNEYCTPRRCLECALGHQILRPRLSIVE